MCLNVGAGFTACGPVFQRVQPAGRPAAGRDARPTENRWDFGRTKLVEGARMADAFRIEHDTMGEMRVPTDALYGAQTARAVENFPISTLRFPRSFIRALALIKKHAAISNEGLDLISKDLSAAIQQ